MRLCLGDFGPIINISLNGSVDLVMYAVELGPYTCDDFKIFWEIVKADSQAEEYIVANEDHYGRHETLRDRGLSFDGFCRFECYQLLTVTPTDMRYNGAQITGVVNLPECFNTSNTTNTTTLWIQGSLFSYHLAHFHRAHTFIIHLLECYLHTTLCLCLTIGFILFDNRSPGGSFRC